MPRNGTAPTSAGVDVSEVRILSVEDILGANDLQEEIVEVPEWGGNVRVRGFSKQKQLDIRTAAGGTENFDADKFEMLVFIYGVVEPEFTVEQVGLLKDKSAAAVDRILARIMDIAGLTAEAKDRAKATFPEAS
jgi:hypothetical protein